MAHFAELDSENKVVRVLFIENYLLNDENGVENPDKGVSFLLDNLGNERRWIQTSYNNNIRVRYAGIGYTYDETLDAFIPPKPHNSWILNETTANWEAPVPMPDDAAEGSYYQWNEDIINWELITE